MMMLCPCQLQQDGIASTEVHDDVVSMPAAAGWHCLDESMSGVHARLVH
jgi:hypothetical protein